MAWVTDEFVHVLRNSVKVAVTSEGNAYRDENGEAWVDDMELSFSIDSTPHFSGTLDRLQAELGDISSTAAERLIETADESEKEAS